MTDEVGFSVAVAHARGTVRALRFLSGAARTDQGAATLGGINAVARCLAIEAAWLADHDPPKRPPLDAYMDALGAAMTAANAWRLVPAHATDARERTTRALEEAVGTVLGLEETLRRP